MAGQSKRKAPTESTKQRKGPRANAQKRVKTSKDFKNAANEKAIQEIIAILEGDGDQVMGCLMALQDKFFSDNPDFVESNAWPGTYMRLDQIPKYWLLQWLKDNTTFATPEQLDALYHASRTAIREIVEYITGLRMHGKLPRVCLIKQILSLVLKCFMQMRLRGTPAWWKTVFNEEEAVLDWNAPGAGVIQPEEVNGNNIVKFKHVDGIVFEPSPDGDVNVKADIKLVKNFSDWDCEYRKGVVNIKFVQQVDALADVSTRCSYEYFKSKADEIYEEFEKKTEAAEEGTVAAQPVKVVKANAKAKSKAVIKPPQRSPMVSVEATVSSADVAAGGRRS